jgi:hypothetical protein
LQEFEFIQKLEKLDRVSLGRNRARPSCTVALAHARSVGLAHVHSVCVAHGHAGAARVHGAGMARVRNAQPMLAGPASASVARDGAEQSPLPGARHGTADGDATAVEAAQKAVVEHPRR